MSEATVGLRERDRHGGLRDRMGGTSQRRWYAVSLTSREKAPQVQSWSCSILTGGRAGAGPVGMSLGPGDLGEVWSEGLARVAAWPACWDLTQGGSRWSASCFSDYSGSILETELERWMSRCWVSGPLGALGKREGAGAGAEQKVRAPLPACQA